MSGQVSLAGKGLVVGYGGAPVLDGVDFAVPSGQFTVIVGPNACGKSTLLKTLARVLRPSSGQVELGGRPISSYSPKQVARQVALLPQSPLKGSVWPTWWRAGATRTKACCANGPQLMNAPCKRP